ncbi:MAG TPA: helix-turn-helix domain-containing protein [Ruminococcus sp.]|nr:helix-turn-helix domain-containing protein [Ruminococcus sp.]
MKKQAKDIHCSSKLGEGALAMDNKFSENLIKFRKKAGLTQSRLAALLMVTPQAVSKWEKGSYPDGELLPKLSKVLDVSLDTLFGLKDDDGAVNVNRAAAEKLQKLPPEDKGSFVMEQLYHMLCAYNSSAAPENIRFPEQLQRETFSQLRTDNELAVARLNQDMQYFCFMRIPENGINSYFSVSQRMIELFGFLADENALRIICLAETLERNIFITKEHIAKALDMPLEIVSDIVDRFDRFGIMWKITANTGDMTFPMYGYVHNVPLLGIFTLAESLVHFLSYREPDIDIWSKAPFREEHKE